MKLRNYICYILNDDNTHTIKTYPADTRKPIKSFLCDGHRYEFDTRCSFLIKDQTTVWYWLTPKRFSTNDRLIVYRAPSGEPDGAVIPPLTIPVANSRIESSPHILRGVTRSHVLKAYRRKQKIGTSIPSWQVFAVLAGAVIIILLIMTGKVNIGGG